MSVPTTMEFVDLKTQYAALKQTIDERIARVLAHGRFIMGPEVTELEEHLSSFTGSTHCVTVASGTEALLIALMALGTKPGDEIITPSFTFAATAEVAVLLGAKPVFVDVQPDTCNIDATRIEEAITPRTRAIIPVSLYGQPPDMDEINDIATRRGVAVIEDAAQSFGALYKGRHSCALSTIGCTSFFPSKPLGCYGDGGAIFTSDDALAQAMREIRVHGQSGRYRHTRIGVGGRMDTLQCAVVLAKLERFNWEIEQRIRIGHRYRELLAPLVPRVTSVAVRPDRSSVYAQYTVRTPQRDKLQLGLKARGIPTAVHYPIPLDRQPAYQEFCRPDFTPVSAQLAGEVISLPMHADMSDEMLKQIADALGNAVA